MKIEVWTGDTDALCLLPHQIMLPRECMQSLCAHPLQHVELVLDVHVTYSNTRLILECIPMPSYMEQERIACVHCWIFEFLQLDQGECVRLKRIIESIVPNAVSASSIELQMMAQYPKRMTIRELIDYGNPIADTSACSIDSIRRQLAMILVSGPGELYKVYMNQVLPIQILGDIYLLRVANTDCERSELPCVAVDLRQCDYCVSSRKKQVERQDRCGEAPRPWQMQMNGSSHSISDLMAGIFLILHPNPHLKSMSRESLEHIRSHEMLIVGASGSGKTMLLAIIAEEIAVFQTSHASMHDIHWLHWDAAVLQVEYELADPNTSAFSFLLEKLYTAVGHDNLAQSLAVVLIDDLDALFDWRYQSQDSGTASIGDGILALMDYIKEIEPMPRICFIATCKVPDPAGQNEWKSRFSKVFELTVPTEAKRMEILIYLQRNVTIAVDNVSNGDTGISISPEATAKRIASVTAGYTARDLARLSRLMVMQTQRNGSITWNDIARALRQVRSSQARYLNVSCPGIHPAKVEFAGYGDIQKEIQQLLQGAFHPTQAMQDLAISPTSGLLLVGPSGCGKTLLAKVSASYAKVNFVSIKSSEVMSKYFGDSEKTIRQLFARAREAAPCILFFDQFDALAHKREFCEGMQDRGEGNSVFNRILATFLNEMDGVGHGNVHKGAHGSMNTSKGLNARILIMAASNRVELLDKALIRPGRFDKQIQLSYPTEDDRKAILNLYTRKMPLADNVDLDALAARTFDDQPFSGADLANVCKEAALMALREDMNVEQIEQRHFINAYECRLMTYREMNAIIKKEER